MAARSLAREENACNFAPPCQRLFGKHARVKLGSFHVFHQQLTDNPKWPDHRAPQTFYTARCRWVQLRQVLLARPVPTVFPCILQKLGNAEQQQHDATDNFD